MKTFLLLFISLACLSGVRSQQLVQSSDPVVIKPGDSYKLSCTASGFTFSDYSMSWVRQTPGGGLQWLGYINTGGGTNYHDSVKGRFTFTRENSKNLLHLQMTNVKPEDTAVYYCARYWELYYFDIWGNGQYVAVSSVTTKAPTVFPLVPCCDPSPSGTVSIGCLSTGYFPTPVDVLWNSGSITSGIRNFPAVFGSQGSYLSTSLLTISASEWTSDKKYVCNVSHKPSGVKIDKEVPACSSGKTVSPTVEVMQASCGENGSVDLVCLISGYSPKDINVEWLLNGEQTSIIPSNSTPYKEDDGTFGSLSKVSVPKNDWNAGDTYTCKVNHPGTQTKKEDTIKKCPVPENLVPKVVVLPPSPKDILVTKQPKVICLVSQVESPETLTIKWNREDGKRPLAFNSEPEMDYSGRYSVKSTLKISLSDWSSGKSFTCVVQTSDLPSPIEKPIKMTAVETTEPAVYVFPPHTNELASHDFVTVSCLVKGFKPKLINVQWSKNGIVQDEDYYKTTEPMQLEDEETYFMYSSLTIEKSDWNRGATLTCSAIHNKITSTDIKKSREYVIWDCSTEEDEDSLWSTAVTFITLFLISFFYSATITIVKVKWFISRVLQFENHDQHFVTVLDAVTQ